MNNENTTVENDVLTNETDQKIYSKKAIWGFSFLFTTMVGGILLMQNLKDIGKKKEALQVLLVSILITAVSIIIVNIPEKPTSSLTNICNLIGGGFLTEYYFNRHFPNADNFPKKKIWKPLIISIIVCIPFILALIYSNDF